MVFAHLVPDAFDVSRRKRDVVGKAIRKSEPLSIWHDHESVGTEDGGAFWTVGVVDILIALPMEDIGTGEMASTSDKGDMGEMWERK